MHHRVRNFFAMCTFELLGSSGASSSIAGCHLLTVKATVGRRASRFELRAAGHLLLRFGFGGAAPPVDGADGAGDGAPLRRLLYGS